MWYAGGMKTFIANLKHLVTHDLTEDRASISAHRDAFEAYVKQLEAKIAALDAHVEDLARQAATVLKAKKDK